MLTFDAEKHEYKWDGVIVPSVTQILRPCYDFSMIDPAVLERKRQIGVAVHSAIALEIDGNLDEASIAPEIAGYLKAWRNFRADVDLHEADFGDVEIPQYQHVLGYAGTPDMAVFLDGKWSVIDVKTAAAMHPAWSLQLAAYKGLLDTHTKIGMSAIAHRYSLRLYESGTFNLDEHKNKADWTTFLSFLNCHRWKQENIK